MADKDDLFIEYKYIRTGKGLNIWLKKDSGFLPVSFICDILENENECTILKEYSMKRGADCLVLKANFNNHNLLLKKFCLHKIKNKIRHKGFAYSEFVNSVRAARLGISVPEPYAYFEIKNQFIPLVNICGVINEFLSEYSQLSEIYDNQLKILSVLIQPVIDCYKTGANHIDITPINVFYNTENQKYSIIDWQYCSFGRSYNDIQLILHASRIFNYFELKYDSDTAVNWLVDLHNKSASKMPRTEFVAKVMKLENRKLHTCHRLSLDEAGLGIK